MICYFLLFCFGPPATKTFDFIYYSILKLATIQRFDNIRWDNKWDGTIFIPPIYGDFIKETE